jgi:hypothetical protein
MDCHRPAGHSLCIKKVSGTLGLRGHHVSCTRCRVPDTFFMHHSLPLLPLLPHCHHCHTAISRFQTPHRHKKGVWNVGLARTPRFLAQGVGFQHLFYAQAIRCHYCHYCHADITDIGCARGRLPGPLPSQVVKMAKSHVWAIGRETTVFFVFSRRRKFAPTGRSACSALSFENTGGVARI